MTAWGTFFCFLLLWVGSPSAHALQAVVDVKPQIVELTDFPIEYFIDPSQSLDYEAVRRQSFETTTSTTSLGTQAPVTWYRVALHNPGTAVRRLFLHLPKAYHVRSVSVFEERNGKLIDQASVNLDEASDHPLIYQGKVVYPFTIPAEETTFLYVRSNAYTHQWFSLKIYGDEQSRRALAGGQLDIALLVGMMLALVFYNGLLYFATSKKENIFYSLYLISGLVWIALSYGLIASAFNAYGDAVFVLNLSLIAMPIFLTLFMMAIFETRKFYRTEHRVLQGMLALLVATFLYGLFDIAAALKPASSLAALMMVVTLSVSISLFRKGNPLVKFFLVGHTFFVIFNGLAVAYYKGLVEPSYINSHGVGIGIVLEALTLAFIISYRIKVLEDIRSRQGELKRQAATDPLTRLYNRRHFMVEGEYMVEQARAAGRPLSVIAVDIDHFKAVNDTHGHGVGDRVLTNVADIFRQFSRDQDLVARFGGEEFVVLLPGADHAEAYGCAERIRKAVEAHTLEGDGGVPIRVTVSLGLTEVNGVAESLENAVHRADKALYEAKTSGRNRVCFSGGAGG
ncbi:sensor domain-containing diguanylate cyclase [Hydrocarboniclastica marina]|uniref:diguanylate cyclase n=1 Tax=Hydrocarboniclastica marina TaxID=2259620 RepID=A0A4P7XKQ5_9ALTE|nr:diguanylate cyclase [Hydrocarboniclastica marina]QCF27485.1 GGDEF domain-containing protein [Hydrocarboniclastica marina]